MLAVLAENTLSLTQPAQPPHRVGISAQPDSPYNPSYTLVPAMAVPECRSWRNKVKSGALSDNPVPGCGMWYLF